MVQRRTTARPLLGRPAGGSPPLNQMNIEIAKNELSTGFNYL
jgi:hypothetical protein